MIHWMKIWYQIKWTDDRVEDDLLLLQLDVHLQVEQEPSYLFDLKMTSQCKNRVAFDANKLSYAKMFTYKNGYLCNLT